MTLDLRNDIPPRILPTSEVDISVNRLNIDLWIAIFRSGVDESGNKEGHIIVIRTYSD